MGASAKQTGLSSLTEPSCTVSALTGFDPSRVAALIAKSSPLPWHRANLANVTTRVERGAATFMSEPYDIRHTSYRSGDNELATLAVNLLPQLLAIAMEARRGATDTGATAEGGDSAGRNAASPNQGRP
jgi:hypothetical protein